MTVHNVLNRIQRSGGYMTVLTGAGVSTESGIPDYRSPGGLYARRPGFKPLSIQQFMSGPHEQQRYWARSLFGYSTMTGRRCNAAHMAVQRLADAGPVRAVITQNIDGLHHLARHGGIGDNPEQLYKSDNRDGRRGELIELHGNIHLARCLQCGARTPRAEVQQALVKANQPLLAAAEIERSRQRPDADYDLDEDVVKQVQLVHCSCCRTGLLRPDVVLFGENVPSPLVAQCLTMVETSPLLLCLGTSLAVYSARRFVDHAHRWRIPIVIINATPTRCDGLADVIVRTDSVARFMLDLEEAIMKEF